jgi:hypothetical protein
MPMKILVFKYKVKASATREFNALEILSQPSLVIKWGVSNFFNDLLAVIIRLLLMLVFEIPHSSLFCQTTNLNLLQTKAQYAGFCVNPVKIGFSRCLPVFRLGE